MRLKIKRLQAGLGSREALCRDTEQSDTGFCLGRSVRQLFKELTVQTLVVGTEVQTPGRKLLLYSKYECRMRIKEAEILGRET